MRARGRPTPAWADVGSRAGRTLIAASCASIIFACAAFAIFIGTRWSWDPAIGGPVAALISLAAYELMLLIVIRTAQTSEVVAITGADEARENMLKARAMLRRRRPAIVTIYLSFGVAMGLIAGSLDSWIPDVLWLAGSVLLGALLPMVFLPVIKRRLISIARNKPATS